jgi:hypothetical protein
MIGGKIAKGPTGPEIREWFMKGVTIQEIKSPNAETHMREGLDAAYAAAEERKRQENFARRRADPEYVKYGVDECGATGGGHGSMQLQSDGRRYCEYCGAECLPEHVKEWESGND